MYARLARPGHRCYVDGESPMARVGETLRQRGGRGCPLSIWELATRAPEKGPRPRRFFPLWRACDHSARKGRYLVARIISISRAQLHLASTASHRAEAPAFVRSSHHSSSYDTLQHFLQRCQARGGFWPPVPWCAPAAAPTTTHRIDGASHRGARQATTTQSSRR